MQSHRSDLVAGPTAAINRLLANYQCGHCNNTTETRTDPHGNTHLLIHHDDGCPVLEGAISPLPDTLRAANPHTT
ncbi:hypothetical protein [Streptomyces globosus]|uniref:hypothetical protein n=1 Tax=Streptomyces globosus TaxID=68209 RepID=UPI0031D4BBEE